MLTHLIGICALFLIAKVICMLTNGRCKSKVCLVGKVAIVTGGNSGIGYETALNFATRGCKVIIADIVDSSSNVKKIIETTRNENVTYKYLDLGNFGAIRDFCAEIIRSEDKIDILINNAGTIGFSKITKDGFSNILQVNYLGPFLLIHLLIDLLKKSKEARIVNVSSAGAFLHRPSFPSVNESQQANNLAEAFVSYSNSKLFCLIASKIFGEKLGRFGITCNAVHPGVVMTPMCERLISQCKNFNKIFVVVAFIGQNFFKSAEEGAQTTLYCALDDEIKGVSGKFFADCRAIFKPKAATNKLYCQNLWKNTEELVGLADDEKLL